MMNSMHGSDDQHLDALFQAYHDACGAPEAGANFMPNLWARIESRQRFTFLFRRMANALTTAAVALSLVLGIYMATRRSISTDSTQTYGKPWAEANAPVSMDFANPPPRELPAARPSR